MKKILLVDDKATIGKVLSTYLGKEYELEYFEDALKAIAWLESGNEPDLIISDIRMPYMTGDEFLHCLKGNELFKHIPVVMPSSEESTTERIRLLQSGAEDYILKPFNPMELKARIHRFL
ncbi:MAG: response regulator [Bacteroides sp.]|nr:response regulator [Bacteroides sp.]